jgi:hypothetical protein
MIADEEIASSVAFWDFKTCPWGRVVLGVAEWKGSGRRPGLFLKLSPMASMSIRTVLRL